MSAAGRRAELALALGIALWLLALATRAIIWTRWIPGRGPWTDTRTALTMTRQDAMVIAGFTALAALALAGAPGRAHRPVRAAILLVYAVLGMGLAINVPALAILGTPIGKSLLIRADGFRSLTPITAIAAAAEPARVAGLVLAALALWLVPRVLVRAWARLGRPRAGLVAVAACGLLLAGWYALRPPVLADTRSAARAANPTLVLVRSLLLGPPVDLLALPAAAPAPGPAQPALPYLQGPPPRGVVVIVLESVGADSAYGESPVKPAGLMPHLVALGTAGLRFEAIHTPVPASTDSAIALLSGRYPGYPPRTAPELVGPPSLPLALARRGFATAFAMSGDLAFQDLRTYADAQRFGHVVDMAGVRCLLPGAGADGPRPLRSIDDRCLAPRLFDWLATIGQRRFFALLWTGQTHYPYVSAAFPRGDGTLAAYVAALRESDALVGAIVGRLRADPHLADTLVVVLGDHGEAFGEHGFQLHANSVFREETRVPLVMAAPALAARPPILRSGSTIDIAATILGLLLPGETAFGQGASLLAAGPERAAFSVALGTADQAGIVLGAQALQLDLAAGTVDAYDHAVDPVERHPRRLSAAERATAMGRFARAAREAAAGAPRPSLDPPAPAH